MSFWETFTTAAQTPTAMLVGLGVSIPFFAKRTVAEPAPAPTDEPTPQSLQDQIEQLQAENAALRVDLHLTQNIQGATLERFRTTFYELPIPCFTVNDQGYVVEWNRACEGFFFLPEHQAIDRQIDEILGTGIFRNDAQGMIYMVFMGLNPAPIEIELNIEGKPRQVKWFASPIRNREGQVVGALNTLGVLPKVEITNQN